jgi:hypothetical protein
MNFRQSAPSVSYAPPLRSIEVLPPLVPAVMLLGVGGDMNFRQSAPSVSYAPQLRTIEVLPPLPPTIPTLLPYGPWLEPARMVVARRRRFVLPRFDAAQLPMIPPVVVEEPPPVGAPRALTRRVF